MRYLAARVRAGIVVAWIVVALLAGARVAAAGTGGRMGGGSWGGGGGGGWHSSSSSSSSHSWSSSSSSWSSSSSGWSSGGSSSSGDGTIDFIIVLGMIGFVIVSGVVKLISDNVGGGGGNIRYTPSYSYTPSFDAGVDVGVMRVVIDGRARKLVQSELARIAGVADTATPAGRAKMLREVTTMLRRLRDAWIYGGAVNEAMTAQAKAKATFDRHVDDARARFREETIANVQGKQQGAASTTEYIPKSSEGAGVILVSIVLATRCELYTIRKIGDGEDLRKALESAGNLDANELVAVEIVWQPAEETDRLSSVQLEAKYPHPQLIKITGALAGKVFCAYCSGPYPAELKTCPHCGAATASDQGNATG